LTTGTIRIDKWLWYARFYKSRTLASRAVTAGRVRINSERVVKSHGSVRPGDVLTFPHGHDIRVIRVVNLGERRGPAPEARELYEDLAPPQAAPAAPAEIATSARRDRGAGRPTKQERRAMEAFKQAHDGGT
jgi:ribosome-associated heat shock protein Hsp15